MPSTWLSSEILAIENKSELLENACLTRIECTLWTLITKRPKNRMDTCWWITSPAHHRIIKFLQTYLEYYAYHFGVNSTEPTRVETKPAGKHSTATKTTCSRKRPVQFITWSNACIPEWQKYTLGAPEFRKIPEGYVIIEMYNTSRNKSYQPEQGGVLINGENYWPVKLKHWCTGHIKWVKLHSDDPTVQSIVKETMENTTDPKINYCPK